MSDQLNAIPVDSGGKKGEPSQSISEKTGKIYELPIHGNKDDTGQPESKNVSEKSKENDSGMANKAGGLPSKIVERVQKLLNNTSRRERKKGVDQLGRHFHSWLIMRATGIARGRGAKFLVSEDEIKDVIQDLYTSIVRLIKTQPNIENLEGYLVGCLQNQIYERQKKKDRGRVVRGADSNEEEHSLAVNSKGLFLWNIDTQQGEKKIGILLSITTKDCLEKLLEYLGKKPSKMYTSKIDAWLLNKAGGWTQDEVAVLFRKSRGTVSHWIADVSKDMGGFLDKNDCA